MTHGEGRRDHHQRDQKDRRGDLHLVPHRIAPGREPGLFELVDEGRQIPDRNELGLAEAVEDAVLRQGGVQAHLRGLDGACLGVAALAEVPGLGAVQHPSVPIQPRRAGGDALGRPAVGIEIHEGRVEQHRQVGTGAFGVDHGLPLGSALAQPQALGRDHQDRRAAAVVAVDQVVVTLGGGRDDRVEHRHRHNPDQPHHRQRRGQAAQRRAAGGADHHQLGRARQADEQSHRRQHNHQRQDFVVRGGHVHQRDAQHLAEGQVGEILQFVDQVDQQQQHQKDRKDQREGPQELAGEIAVEDHAAPPAGRRRRAGRRHMSGRAAK